MEGKTRVKARRPVRKPPPKPRDAGGLDQKVVAEVMRHCQIPVVVVFFLNWETTVFPGYLCEGFERSPQWIQRLWPQQLEEWGFFKQKEWDLSGRAQQECGKICRAWAACFEVTPHEESLAEAKLFRNLPIHSGRMEVHVHM